MTAAFHFSDGDQHEPNNGYFSGQLGSSLTTGSYGIDLTSWTEWQTCRTAGALTVTVNGQLAFAGANGQTFDQWGQSIAR